MSEFLAMGGYAKYVWSSWGISVVVLVLAVVLTKRMLAHTRSRVIRRQASMKEASS
ncbi:MAG: heme exporter protein CcmD [Gammaproteobacteria bacterium]